MQRLSGHCRFEALLPRRRHRGIKGEESVTRERRVAVIGASGQIGSLVARALSQRGVRLVAISRQRGDALSTDELSHC
ncbi:NAD-dependent epimerase/dehydratase family protein [Auritidibacter sp. NML100628]|uniref:NAD-dependent epimerase/dehydratase family protein n=1 Tax=Auritidibacter TaxID=1160973 RepID=UPI000D72BFDF|nr:hypothetical protein DCC24_06425 [Auritidibacter sp. NML100628]